VVGFGWGWGMWFGLGIWHCGWQGLVVYRVHDVTMYGIVT